MKAWTIVGYAFDADIYCDGICILQALGEITPEQEKAATYVYDVTVPLFDGAATVEGALDVVATRRSIDRKDERSYDSGDFPKVIFASEEFPDYCPRCAQCGGVLDGFDPDDYTTDDDDESEN